MQNIIKAFINGALSAYMTEVKKNDIGGSLARKNLEISELDVYPDALLQHGIPLLVKKGTIRNVSIEVPTKFKTEPIVVNIDSVTILASLCKQGVTPLQVINMKIHLLKAYKYFRKRFKLLLGLLGKESFLSVVLQIMSNVIVSINHIHIQIEYTSNAIFDDTVSTFTGNESFTRLSDIESTFNFNDDDDDDDDEKSKKSKKKDDDSGDGFSSDDSSNSDDDLSTANRFQLYESQINSTTDDKVTSIGIVISKLVIHNPASLITPTPNTITKEVVFTNLGVFMDAEIPSISKDRSKIESEMEKLFNSKNHNWILEPFSFVSLIKYTKDNPQFFFEPIIKEIAVNIREDYIPVILDLVKGFDKLQKKFAVAHIPRPSNDYPKLLWTYVHKCAVSKISNPTHDFSKALNLLIQRKIFLKNYKKKKPQNLNVIRVMEETLDYSTIVAFRAAYRLVHRKRKKPKGKSMITIRTTAKILKVINIDPVRLVTGTIGMAAVNFTGDLVSIILRRPSNHRHLTINVRKPRFSFEKDLKSYIINATISYLSIKSKHHKEKELTLFRSMNNDQLEMKVSMKIPFRSYSNWYFSLDVSKNHYTINLEAVLQVLSDLSTTDFFAITGPPNPSDIVSFLRKIKLELNVKICSSIIKIVGSQKNRAIQIAFDKLLFSTDTQTLHRAIKLEKSWVSLITDTEAKISSDFSLDGSMVDKDLTISIPKFSFNVPFKYVVVLEDFIGLFIKYKSAFTGVSSLPKIDINVTVDMKGMEANIKSPKSGKSKSFKIRKLQLNYKDSVIKFSLSKIKLAHLFHLSDLSLYFDKKTLDFKLKEVSAKVIKLIGLLPKDAFQILQNKNTQNTDNDEDSDPSNDKSDSDSDSESENDDKNEKRIVKKVQLPSDIKVNFAIDKVDIDLHAHKTEPFIISIKDILANGEKGQIKAGLIMSQVEFAKKIISQNIELKSQIKLGEIPEIATKINNFNFLVTKDLIDFFVKISKKVPALNVPIPKSLGFKCKFSLQLDQISLSNDFILKNLNTNVNINDSKIDASVGIDSVSSSFMKFESKDLAKVKVNLEEKEIDLTINLEEMTVFVIPLLDVIAMFPKSETPKIPKINLQVKVKPLQINLCFVENSLNVLLNSPLKFKFNTLNSQNPKVSMKMMKLLVNLNSNEIVNIRSLKFKLDKSINLEIPSIIVTLSLAKVYTLIKMISYIAESSLISDPKTKIAIYTIPIDTISTKIPLIDIIIHQTKSRRCISLTLNDTELYLKNHDKKSDFMASTNAHFSASDGILSFDLTPSFKITCNGMFSETIKNLVVESRNPIKFEISTYVINQILKNLTATEDETEKPYSIVNETGCKITIIIDEKKYSLDPQDHLPKLRKFTESDISVRINHVTNPIKIYSAFSKISYPLFFGKHFILVWFDMRKLQLRLLSPITFKNKSNVDLIVSFGDQRIELKNGDIHCLNYKISNVNVITMECNGDKQEIPLDESCAVKLDNKFIVVSKKRKIETLHTAIVFSTPFYIRNELISDLTISFKDQKEESKDQEIILKGGEVVPFPFFQPAAELISFDILDSKDIKGVHVDLQLKKLLNERYTLKTKDNENNEFVLQFSLTNEKLNIISISPLIIYYNSLSIPLRFSLSSDMIINDYSILNLEDNLLDIYPFQNTQNIWNISNPTMFSPQTQDDDDDNVSAQVFLATKYSTKWAEKPFVLDNYEIIDDVAIPIDSNKISYAHCHIMANSRMRPNTFIFFISPKFVINNQTSTTFSLNFLDEADVELPPNSTIPITLIRKSFEISIAIVPKSTSNEAGSNSSTEKLINEKQKLTYSRRIPIDKIYSQYINLPPEKNPVLLQYSKEKEICFINILLNRQLPYVFINNTDSKVVFIQKDTSDSSHIVMPFKSMEFFIYDENMPTVIYCILRDHVKFELDVNKPTFPIKIATPDRSDTDLNLYYYVDLSPTKGSTIILCNAENDELNLKGNSKINENFIENLKLANQKDESSFSISLADLPRLRNDLINISVNFNQVSFLITTTQFQELCNISLKDLLLESTIHDFYVKSQIYVGAIKIDDQNLYAVYPSVIQILPSGNQPAIFFKVKSFGSHKYGKIELSVRPINVQIDLSFISDVIGDIFYAENNSNPDDDDKESSEDNKNNDKIDFTMNEVPISEIIHNLLPKESKYHINNLDIHPLVIHLSFHTKTTRSIHPLQQKFQFRGFYNVIPSFDNVTISIDEYHSFKNLSGTAEEIFCRIEQDIKDRIVNQISLRNTVKGTKGRIKNAVNNLIHPQEISKTETRTHKILRRTTYIFSIAESTFSYVSSLMDLYTEAPVFIRTDETSLGALQWGFKSFVNSVGEGAKKLVTEPKRRGLVNGKQDYCGYIYGAGVGVTKCAAHIVSGTCNLGASLFSGTRRMIFTEKVSFVDHREREPSLGMHSADDEQLLWYTGSVFSGLIEVYSRSIYIQEENKYITNIIRAEIDGTKVIVYDVEQNKFETNFEEENKAISFYNIIESQLLRKKIIDMPEQTP